MQSTISKAVELIHAIEGGYVNDKDDPGGPTNKGITLVTLTAWRRKPCTIDDLQKLTDEEADEIYLAQYAAPVRYDDLPAGLDFTMLDCSLNSGPSRANKLLQTVLGFTGRDIDGVLGEHTMAAIQAAGNAVLDLVARFNDARLAFMRTLKGWSKFGKGWTNRVNEVGIQAQALALGYAPSVPVVAGPQAKATGPTRVLSSANGKAAVAAVTGVGITAGTLSATLSSALQPYSGIKAVEYVLLGCTMVSAAVPLWMAVRRAASGEAAA